MKTDTQEKSAVKLVTKTVTIESKTVALPIDNIDTDQIIPARFLKTTSMEGLGANLFLDWRYLPDGSPNPDFALNKPSAKGAEILVAGDNFGCGSSREHAPWALKQYGFKAIISTSFADIFKGNALKNGLLPIIMPPDIHAELLKWPGITLKIDLATQTVTLAGGRTVEFPIDPFAKQCLIEGVDELGYMLNQQPAIAAYEAKHPSSVNTLA
ncbi:MAG TPA: 3-isopropylmalate dehydratase small subunit [Bryobacteraceae bacterium]|nr:3-isopropylmalate dehydratase small subunit [Bryobacteraceae bacterium]